MTIIVKQELCLGLIKMITPADKPTILFTLQQGANTYRIETYTNAYSSLMTLIVDKLSPMGFGMCCGMGSCGTCLVQITYAGSKAKVPVLACDMSVNDELANAIIYMPELRYY